MAYLITLDPGSGDLVKLEMVPFEIRRFQAWRASDNDAAWLKDPIAQEESAWGHVHLEYRKRLVAAMAS